jgi:superfamily II DNA or RNA helicase
MENKLLENKLLENKLLENKLLENKLLENKLLEYQIPHLKSLIEIYNNHHRILDTSDTGTGKTYVAIALCLALNLKPFIICPKSVIASWKEVIEYFSDDVNNSTSTKILNSYKLTTYGKIYSHPILIRSKTDSSILEWNSSIDYSKYLFIFDEVHKCKNLTTSNANLLLSLSNIESSNILMLSATAVDKLKNFYIYGYVFGLYNSEAEFNGFLSRYRNLNNISKLLYPTYATRMCRDHIQNIFKNNNIIMKPIYMKNYEEISNIYSELRIGYDRKNLGFFQKLRQRIELLKTNTIIDLTTQYINIGKSVCIFVNFTNTLKEIAKSLNTTCIIYGQQTELERSKNINMFNSDNSRVIICNIASGGCGISLHDINGKYPRISLISPSWSAQDIIQVLGRIHRAMAKSDAEQHILFCANTFEENVGNILQQKINNIQTINQNGINQTNQTNPTHPTHPTHPTNPTKSNMTKLILSEFEKANNIENNINKKIDNMADDDICFELLNLYEQKKNIKSSDKIKLTEIDKQIKKIELRLNQFK